MLCLSWNISGQKSLLLGYPVIELALLLFYFATVELVLDLAIDRISIICRPEATSKKGWLEEISDSCLIWFLVLWCASITNTFFKINYKIHLKTLRRKVKHNIFINLHFTITHQFLPLSLLLGIFLLRRVLS
jgi:hypothetical protein